MKTEIAGREPEHETNDSDPFIIMEDIGLHLVLWSKQHGFTLPLSLLLQEWRKSNVSFLQRFYPNVIVLEERDLISSIHAVVEAEIYKGIQPIFIDKVYTRDHPQSGEFRLDLGRAVTERGEKAGYFPRPGTAPLQQQFDALIDKLDAERKGIPVTLVDDALIGGGTLLYIMHELFKRHVNVVSVCVGIATMDGIQRLNEKGISVHSAQIRETSKDIVCEADLYPGIPGAGILVDDSNILRRSPYLVPHMPEALAKELLAIVNDDNIVEFYIHANLQSILLFQLIESASGKPVRVEDLELPLTSMPSMSPNKRIIDFLLENLKFFVGFNEYKSNH